MLSFPFLEAIFNGPSLSTLDRLVRLIASSTGFWDRYYGDRFPLVTSHSRVVIFSALGYLYSSISARLVRPDNARSVLAAGCLLGGMDDLCEYTYDTCRQSINLDTINDWLSFIDGIPGSDGSLSPEQTLTSVFGQYARRLRDDVFHFLVATLPNLLGVNPSAVSESGLSQGKAGRETMLQIFSLVPFDMFKAAVESPDFEIGKSLVPFLWSAFTHHPFRLRSYSV